MKQMKQKMVDTESPVYRIGADPLGNGRSRVCARLDTMPTELQAYAYLVFLGSGCMDTFRGFLSGCGSGCFYLDDFGVVEL